MDRGLRAQLSPNEETAVRKIAAGSTGNVQLDHLAQLAVLKLIEARDVRMTPMGAARMAARRAARTDL
jgi:hypothetical protein